MPSFSGYWRTALDAAQDPKTLRRYGHALVDELDFSNVQWVAIGYEPPRLRYAPGEPEDPPCECFNIGPHQRVE